MILLNPTLGAKIRGWIVSIFAVFVLVGQFWPAVEHAGWAGTVTKVYGFALALIELLTHATPLGGTTSINTKQSATADVLVQGAPVRGPLPD